MNIVCFSMQNLFLPLMIIYSSAQIILLLIAMQDRGKLNVTINKRQNPSLNYSESDSQSEPLDSNEFIDSNLSETNQILPPIQKQQPPSPSKIKEKTQVKVPQAQQVQKNQNTSKLSAHNHSKSHEIPQQNVNLRGKNQRRNNVKMNSFQLMSPQLQQKILSTKINKSSVINGEQKAIVDRNQSIEDKKIEEINKKQQKLSSSIHDLKGNYEELQRQQKQVKQQKKKRNESPLGLQLSPEKQKQILDFLQLKQKEKEERKKKLQNIALKQEHKRKLQQKQLEMLKEKQKKYRLKQLKKYSKFQQKHQEIKMSLQQKQKKAEEVIQRYEGRVGYHIRAQKEQEEKKKKQQYEEMKILQERKDMVKPHDENQLMEHQRWHDDKLDQLNYERIQAREEEQQRIMEENGRFSQIWHGNSHTIVEEQIHERRKKKRQAKQKARRIKQYKQYIRKHFPPKTYQYRSLDPPQIQERTSNSHRAIRRYPYYKGVSVGQITEQLPVPKTDRQVRKIGDNYLEYVKSLPKKVQSPQEQQYHIEAEDLELLQKKFNGMGKMKRAILPIYDDGRKKKTSIEVTKNIKRDELQMIVMQLQANDQRLRNKQTLLNHNQYGSVNNVQGQQKAINEGFVENIQRKLALLAQL